MIEIAEHEGGVVFAVRLVPRASRDAIDGEYANALKVRITAPAIEDRANEALCRFLAARLNVPNSAVKIVAGERSRSKRIAVSGISPERVLALCVPSR